MTVLRRTLASALLVFAAGAATTQAATTTHKQGDVSLKLAQANTDKIQGYFVRDHPGATYEQPKACKRLSRRAVNCYILEHRTVGTDKQKVLYTTHTKSVVKGRKTSFSTTTTAGDPLPDA